MRDAASAANAQVTYEQIARMSLEDREEQHREAIIKQNDLLLSLGLL